VDSGGGFLIIFGSAFCWSVSSSPDLVCQLIRSRRNLKVAGTNGARTCEEPTSAVQTPPAPWNICFFGWKCMRGSPKVGRKVDSGTFLLGCQLFANRHKRQNEPLVKPGTRSFSRQRTLLIQDCPAQIVRQVGVGEGETDASLLESPPKSAPASTYSVKIASSRSSKARFSSWPSSVYR
jgi:hypothetical protein